MIAMNLIELSFAFAVSDSDVIDNFNLECLNFQSDKRFRIARITN